MTLYARGYRPYEGALRTKGPRWLPIANEGFRGAVQGKAYRVFFFIILAIFVILGFFIYFESPVLTEAFLRRGPAEVQDVAKMAARQMAMKDPPSANLEAAVVLFHEWTTLFVMLLTLFVGAGLVADDLKARALPLYLVRPITPFDYYLGKLLIPIRVLARTVLAPALLLVLLAALFRPSDEIFDFLGRQGRLVRAIFLHFAVLAVSYSSLALLFSAITPRRITAIVLGAAVFLGGEILRGALRRVPGGVVDFLRGASIAGDTRAILYRGIGREPGDAAWNPFPGNGSIAIALAGIVLVAAWVVLARARSVEVTA